MAQKRGSTAPLQDGAALFDKAAERGFFQGLPPMERKCRRSLLIDAMEQAEQAENLRLVCAPLPTRLPSYLYGHRSSVPNGSYVGRRTSRFTSQRCGSSWKITSLHAGAPPAAACVLLCLIDARCSCTEECLTLIQEFAYDISPPHLGLIFEKLMALDAETGAALRSPIDRTYPLISNVTDDYRFEILEGLCLSALSDLPTVDAHVL